MWSNEGSKRSMRRERRESSDVDRGRGTQTEGGRSTSFDAS